MESSENPAKLMRLFKLTTATIFQRKAWAICALAILILPYVLPWISTASEKPLLMQPARVQAAWVILWLCSLSWGLFTAAREGENNAKSGLGEYFQTTGIGPTRQLLELWLAILIYILPCTMMAALVSQFGAAPGHPLEKEWWWVVILQYSCLFVLAISPLIAVAISLASRFGGITGFSVCLLLALYGLYGIGYLDSLLKVEENPLLRGVLVFSPQYRFADLTQRMYFKSGAIAADSFALMVLYFLGLGVLYAGVARLCFRTKCDF